MATLFLVSGFTAFFIAVIEQLIPLRSMKALLSILFSVGGCLLISHMDVRTFVLTTVAASFFGPTLALAADRLSTFRPALVQSIRPRE